MGIVKYKKVTNLLINMGLITWIIGFNLYALIMGMFHRQLKDRHGEIKSLILSNLVIISGILLIFLFKN